MSIELEVCQTAEPCLQVLSESVKVSELALDC